MTRATILIVDDEPHMRRILEMMLEGFGHRVLAADSAEKALSTLGAEHVDLVLSDLQLPGMSGMELLPRIRTSWPNSSLSSSVSATAAQLIVMYGSLARGDSM